jgi:hypothetical protein
MPSSDMSAAAWITDGGIPWQQLVTFGPAGFDTYVRLRFLPDPLHPGQEESERHPDEPSQHERLRTALDVLRQHTRTSDDCYFCLWDGWGSDIEGDESPEIAPAFPPSVLEGPKLVIPHRAYYLFRGGLSQFGKWGAADMWPGQPRLDMPDPAFIWPADHAWCLANDVDSHYAGIGASSVASEALLTHSRLDVVPADPSAEQLHYS